MEKSKFLEKLEEMQNKNEEFKKITSDKVYESGKPILRPIGIIQSIALIILCLSPIVWIWIGWGLFWKIALTSLFVVLLTYIFYEGVKKVVRKEILNNINLKK